MPFSTSPRRLNLKMTRQPDDVTCGPTCLQSIYDYYGDNISLEQVIREVPMLRGGGTLAANLGYHALHRGYQAIIYSYNLVLFDPSWAGLEAEALLEKLDRQQRLKDSPKFNAATRAYKNFLNAGGQVRFDDLTPDLILGFLGHKIPILTGLSATFLYRAKRENPVTNEPDDIKGEPVGHFVLLSGFDPSTRKLEITDPYHPNPVSETQSYEVTLEHLVNAILLGVVTYDANLLILKKP